MKTDMKFPCLVTCNKIQCIAINENHVIHLEGDYKGKLCITPLFTTYSAPDSQTRYGHESKDYEFFGLCLSNSINHFDINVHEELTITRTIEVNDIDFSPWKGDTKLFFDDVETLKQQTWKPTVGEQVDMTFNGDVHRTGELLFVSDQYAIVRIGEKQEQHYHLGAWKITKPVSNEDKLKKLWLECGENINLFIAAVSKQYKEV